MIDENFLMNTIMKSGSFYLIPSARTVNSAPQRWKEDDIIHILQENSIILEMEHDLGKGNVEHNMAFGIQTDSWSLRKLKLSYLILKTETICITCIYVADVSGNSFI